MKPHLAPLLALLPLATLGAAEPALPDFSDTKLDLPSTALIAAVPPPLPATTAMRRAAVARRQLARAAAAPAEPGLLGPQGDLDPKMVVPPDPAADAKILVAKPRTDVDAR